MGHKARHPLLAKLSCFAVVFAAHCATFQVPSCHRRVNSLRVCRRYNTMSASYGYSLQVAPAACQSFVRAPPLATCADSDDEEDDVGEGVESMSRWFREACGRKKPAELDDILSYLASLEKSVAAAALRLGNCNDKTALHMACQFRRGSDGPLLVNALLDFGGDIDCSTRRGHTPLIYAAGRGNDAIVRALLERGANTRIKTVTGITAASMGRRHSQPDTAALIASVEAADSRPWLDYTNNKDALAAQAEHMRLSPSFRKHNEENATAAALEHLKRGEQAEAIAEALREGEQTGRQSLVDTLVQAFARKAIDRNAEDVLRRAFRSVLAMADPQMLLNIFSICREEEIGRALSRRQLRDRRAVQMLFRALLLELPALSSSVLCDVSVANIAASTSLSLAMEVVKLRTRCADGDLQAVEIMWRDAMSTLVNSGTTGMYVSDVTYVAGIRLTKHMGGLVMSYCVHLLRWACAMRSVSSAWLEMAEEIVCFTMQTKHAHKLDEAVKQIPEGLPAEVGNMIQAGKRKVILPSAGLEPPAYVSKQTKGLELGDDVQEYCLLSAVHWVTDDEAIGKIRNELQKMIDGLENHERLLVGMDTEWGECAGHDSHAAPSVVQIAALDQVWVLDTALPGPHTRLLIRWLFSCERFLLVGFAFAHDVQRLASLACDDGDNAPSSRHGILRAEVLDIQQQAQKYSPKGLTPGLKAVSEAWLGTTIDKTEQCSNWDRRPLSASQLKYAAIDAAVLLDIAQSMGGSDGMFPSEKEDAKLSDVQNR